MILISMFVAIAMSPPHYYSTVGRESLEKLTNPIALEMMATGDQDPAERLRAILAKHAGARVAALFGNKFLITGEFDPAQMRSELQRSSAAAARLLAVYRERRASTLLIADGRIRAQFTRRMTPAQVQQRAKEAGALSARRLRADVNTYEIIAPTPEATAQVASTLQESHAAIWAHPDFIYQHRRLFVPNDPLLDDQWHHQLIGSMGAWDISLGSPDSIIAILDSGTDMRHPDLAAKLVFPRDEIGQDDDPSPDPTDAHGTGTSGLAAAITNNSEGIAGVCPNCSVMPIRIMSEQGWGRYGADADAMYWAGDHGAGVLSNSWGPAGATTVPRNLDTAIRHVADNARGGKGAVILFAAGNEGRENFDYELASHPLVVGVGASSYRDARENYSNYGPQLTLIAPAGSVTTDILGNDGYARGDYMYVFGGTSASSPVAAGVAGLVLGINPELTRGQVQTLLTDTADPVGNLAYGADGRNDYYGAGRVNALRAAQAASGGEICQPVEEICDNGVDDDCDSLADTEDPSCAPTELAVGVVCSQDYQCGTDGLCLNEAYGFPDGYCTRRCGAGCPENTVCLDGDNGRVCLATCTSAADCRAGYDCLAVGQNGALGCYPSCTVTGCQSATETCNAQTGECEHDGDVVPGGGCTEDLECAANGTCFSEEWSGLPGGYCGVSCSTAADCPEGGTCFNVGRFSLCGIGCQFSTDCRAGYACWPNDDGTGACWGACTSDEDCNGEVCNSFGLCGDAMPPQTPKPSCTCDTTTACDPDCACDPECDVTKQTKTVEDKGCAATEPSWAAVLAVVAALAAAAWRGRRRRQRGP